MGQIFSSTLHQAAFHGDTKTIKKLVKKFSHKRHADPSHPGLDVLEQGHTAMFMAVTAGQTEAVQVLIQSGADPNVICLVERVTWTFQWSALHEACW